MTYTVLLGEPAACARAAREILRDLPDWFGVPETAEMYIKSCGELPCFLCLDGEEAVGLLAIKQHTHWAGDVYVMGVKRAHHRKGVGRLLMDACRDYCRRKGMEYLQVKTLDESCPDEYYARTRAFYLAMGFRPLECLPALWGEDNPCMLMVQKL